MAVAPREGRVSRNLRPAYSSSDTDVAPREGRVSRNVFLLSRYQTVEVAPREGRVSRNAISIVEDDDVFRRAPRGACE